ncbi:phospholipase D-like domain-containing protein [Candidatus Dependentiae bacterium]|nr:phospholipase D-like domain-containing protein [Candidatus Dependentiae bacterium]
MKLKSIIYFLFLFSFALAMEKRELPAMVVTPKKVKALLSEELKIVPSLINLINKLKEGDQLEINSFVLTNKNLIDALIEAKQRGVELRVIVDKQSYKIDHKLLQKLAENGIPVYIFRGDITNHLKTVIWSYRNDQGEILYRVAQGSTNLTHLAEYNWEHTTIIPSDKEIYDIFKNLNDHLVKNSDLLYGQKSIFPGKRKVESQEEEVLKKQKITLESTPKKVTAIGSLTHDLSDSIKKFIERSDAGTSISISTYTYNDFDFTKTLINALKRGVKIKLIIDGATLHNRNARIQSYINSQLLDLTKEGAEIFVFNPNQTELLFKKYPIKAHRKVITIDRPDKKIVIEGSGNFTYLEAINAFVIHPGNLEIFNTFKRANEHLLEESVPYEFILYSQKLKEQESARRQIKF